MITGGAGFIGSHVADAYLGAGHRVVVVDDLSSGSSQNRIPELSFINWISATPLWMRFSSGNNPIS